ncbi:MAG: SDR family oxidoreductase [Planctomycetota bacterium]
MLDSTSRFADRYGPWAVVTGASSGIGREFARELAALGLNVVLVARNESELKTLAEELVTQHGIEARSLAMDLSQPSASHELDLSTIDLDVGLLVANAGFGSAGTFLELDLDEQTNMLDLNCRALMQQTHRFANRMQTRNQSGIIHLSSIVAFQGMPHAAHYAATKAYVQVFAESLRSEFSSLGIDVLAVAPGPTKTGFSSRASLVMSSAMSPSIVAQSSIKKLGRTTTTMPGFQSKLLGLPIRMLPRFLRIQIMGNVGKGMVREKAAV